MIDPAPARSGASSPASSAAPSPATPSSGGPAAADAALPGTTVAELSETELLARIFPHLPAGGSTLVGPGDDAALLAAPDGRYVVSTDVLVEDRHFRRRWSTGEDVGWRAAMQNLADVAAMGARPTALVVSLVTPADLPVAWVEDLARGLGAACATVGAGVVGGDLSGGPVVVVAVTVHGDLDGLAPVLRSGARPGDVVALAGTVGRSAAGLALLEAGRPEVDPAAVTVFRRPAPPLAAGPLAARAGATAMLDVSDGLLRDAARIATASGVVVDLGDPADVLATDLAAARTAADALGVDPVGWLLGGGEDHGLLATFPAGAVPEGFREVGTVRAPAPGAGASASASASVQESAGVGSSAGVTAGTVLVAGDPATTVPGWDHFRP